MDSILYSVNENVATLTLNRPEKYNSFNREMALMLQDYIKKADADNEVRCILIKGQGKAFSAGQDLSEVTGANPVSFKKILSKHYNPLIKIIRNSGKPVIAAVNGVAAGAGANIALCCDIVLASTSASFIQAFSKIGLIPDSGGTYFLPRLIGFQKALALAISGDKVTSAEAEKMGMIYKVFDEEIFETECDVFSRNIAQMPTSAISYIKKAFNASMNNTLEQQLILEDEFQLICSSSDDYNEGVNAFIEKRKPIFKGK